MAKMIIKSNYVKIAPSAGHKVVVHQSQSRDVQHKTKMQAAKFCLNWISGEILKTKKQPFSSNFYIMNLFFLLAQLANAYSYNVI